MRRYIILIFVLLFLASNVYAGEKYEILSATFQLTDDKDFSGEATYYYKPTEKVQFTIKNISKSVYNFAGASYFIGLRDGKVYRLDFSSMLNSNAADEKAIFRPQETITVVCSSLRSFKDIKGIFVTLANKRKIYFEYEELTNPRTLLRKITELVGLGENKDKKHPAKEGWKKEKTASGKIYYIKQEKDQDKPKEDNATNKQ